MPRIAVPGADELFARIEGWAESRPLQTAVTFIENLSLDTQVCNFAEIFRLTRSGAAAWHQAGVRAGDRVLIDLPTGPAFLAALLGAMSCGIYPAAIASLEARSGNQAEAEWRHHFNLLQPTGLASDHPHLVEGAVRLDTATLLSADPQAAPPRVHGRDMGYIQFSSGSTGSPKALFLGMEGIVFNLEQMHHRIPILDVGDVLLSWLPLHHDMGLFGTMLLSLFVGSPLTTYDPALFARSPLIWFRSMDMMRARITVSPPSALHAALNLLERRPIAGMDLSPCDRWLCGAEMVTPTMVRRFDRVLEPYGLSSRVMKPVYGMAEITLAATMPIQGHPPRIDRIVKASYQQDGVATPATPDLPEDDCLEWVGCGHPLRGQAVRIVDDQGALLPERHRGHVEMRSPSLFAGTVEASGVTPRKGDWYDTGDLGYWAEGHLFLTGRSREVIIKNGRNYAPERVEEVASLIPDCGRGAAFGVFDPARQTERVVLALEIHPRLMRDPEQRDRCRLAVRKSLAEAGYEVDEVILEARGSLPRTTSGKIRRSAVRQNYLDRNSPTPA